MADNGLRIPIGADNSGLKRTLSESLTQLTNFTNKTGSLSDVNGKFNEIAKSISANLIPAIKKMSDSFSNSLKGIPAQFDAIEKKISDVEEKLKGLSSVGDRISSAGTSLTAGLTLPIVGLGAASVKAYADIESLQKGLEAVMGSTSAASRELNNLKEVAKLPGLGMKEAVQGSINLQAIGISAGKSRNILQQFGNAVATVGKGRAEFERAIYGVQQLANTDFPLGEDLNIIKDALPQVSNLLKDAFGSSRSDELAKMGVTSKQVLDKILEGLGKLPRVTGGIKGAFENFGDSVTTNLARLGKIIDKNLDISGLIGKLTNSLDGLLTAFEDLNPGIQSLILIVAGLAAAIGPLLVVIGGVISAIPTLVAGFGALKIAILAMTGPIGITIAVIGGLTAAYFLLRDTQRTSVDLQKEWASSLAKANIEAKQQVSELDALYRRTQDVSLSTAERKQAVDDLQKMFPNYFQGIKDETILNGKASDSYKQLRLDIVNASRARAAQAELDKRAQDDLATELKLREGINKAQDQYYNPKSVTITGGGGAMGANAPTYFSEKDVKAQAKKVIEAGLVSLREFYDEVSKRNKPLEDILGIGKDSIDKVFGDAADSLSKVGSKFGKGTEGWYEEEIKRLEELKNSAIVGSKAWTDLNTLIEKYQKLLNPDKIKPIEIEPVAVKDGFNNKLSYLGKSFGTPEEIQVYINSLVDSMQTGFGKLAITVTEGQAKLIAMNAELSKAWSDDLSQGISNGIGSVISSISTAFTSGGSIVEAIGKSVLSVVGNIATQLGQSAIAVGIGMIAIKKAFTNPYTAIAAGIALVALGSFISGSVSKIPEGGSSGSSASTATGSSGVNSYSSNFTSGGSSGGEVRFRIQGTDLVGVLEANNYKTSRLNAG